MSEDYWEEIEEVAGGLQAEILRGLLEAQGIKVWLSQEGGGRSAYATSVGELGMAHILVPASQSRAAREVLRDYYAGKYEDVKFTDESGQPLPEEKESDEEGEPDDGENT